MIAIPLPARGLVTVVDDADAHLADLPWGAHDRGGLWYAAHRAEGTLEYLHHLVLPDCPAGLVRDHINGCSLDNRRSNLRLVSHQDNSRNMGGIKGVGRASHGDGWRAYITIGSKQVSLGTHPSYEEALKARLQAEVLHWGGVPRRAKLYEEYGVV